MFLELIPAHITNNDKKYLVNIKNIILRECYMYEKYIVPKVAVCLNDLKGVFMAMNSLSISSAIIDKLETKITVLRNDLIVVTNMHAN